MNRINVSGDCIGCGICITDCSRRALIMEDGMIVPDDSLCNDCFHCVALCPQNAISISGYDKDEIEDIKDISIDPAALFAFQKNRRSIRNYKEDDVRNEILEKILQAGRFSPTGGNLQTNHFIVVRERLGLLRDKVIETLYGISENDELLENMHLIKYKNTWKKMYEAYKTTGEDRLFFGAPYLIIISNNDLTGNGQVNGGIAASRMELLANAYGLGICYIGFLKRALLIDPNIKSIIGIKDDEEYSLAFVLGYPNVKYLRTVCRKDLDVRYL